MAMSEHGLQIIIIQQLLQAFGQMVLRKLQIQGLHYLLFYNLHISS